MPTAARAMAAVLFAVLAWYVSGLIVPLFPENKEMGLFAEVNTGLGLICGWKLAGPRGGTGYVNAVSYGLTTTVALVVVALFTHSSVTMIENSLRKFYDTPVEAVVAVFELMVEHGTMMLTPEILTTLGVGGVLAGLGTEFVGRRYS
ncbi:MAG: TrgA family protein [Alphaproteobacteria bacterium]|nr:TrgA family protein [Alphaproteobacteria bacterium]